MNVSGFSIIYTDFLGRWFKEALCEINLLIGSQFQHSLPFTLVMISATTVMNFQ
jgi:hypothetical protein